jgi:Flp pilus assembly protein TadB
MKKNVFSQVMKISLFSFIIFLSSCAKKQFHANTALQEKVNASMRANDAYASSEKFSPIETKPEYFNQEIEQATPAQSSKALAKGQNEKLTIKEQLINKMVEKQFKKAMKEDSIKEKVDTKRSGGDMNSYLRLGLIFILAGVIISLIHPVGGVAIVIGVVLALIGLIQMFG